MGNGGRTQEDRGGYTGGVTGRGEELSGWSDSRWYCPLTNGGLKRAAVLRSALCAGIVRAEKRVPATQLLP